MSTSEEIFYKEFTTMMHQLKAMSVPINLNDIDIPGADEIKLLNRCNKIITKFSMLDIQDYSQLPCFNTFSKLNKFLEQLRNRKNYVPIKNIEIPSEYELDELEIFLEQMKPVHQPTLTFPNMTPSKFIVEKKNKVFIGNIQDNYFSKLSGTEQILWGTSNIRARVYDYKGNIRLDKNGNPMYKEVTVPSDALVILADIPLGVPGDYKSSESFMVIDVVTTKSGSKKYIYTIPKKYCYSLNQTALVLSYNKINKFYSGVALAFTTGRYIYLYVIPYKPTSGQTSFRVLKTKTSEDYTDEITLLKDYWVYRNMIFNPDYCVMTEGIKGRENMAYERLDGNLEIYERFNPEKSMGSSQENVEDEFED